MFGDAPAETDDQSAAPTDMPEDSDVQPPDVYEDNADALQEPPASPKPKRHERLGLIFPGQENFQCHTAHDGRSRHQLGSAQTERRHQQQAVGAERFDPEAACAVPDKVAQGNVAVELPLFDVRRQQGKANIIYRFH